MKKTSGTKESKHQRDELRPEYRFDYKQTRPNRFAKDLQGKTLMVVLDPDVAKVFRDGESVNAVLRALLTVMPARRTKQVQADNRRFSRAILATRLC